MVVTCWEGNEPPPEDKHKWGDGGSLISDLSGYLCLSTTQIHIAAFHKERQGGGKTHLSKHIEERPQVER